LDTRTDKYAPSASRPQMSESDIMGPVCRSTQNIRAEFLRGLGGLWNLGYGYRPSIRSSLGSEPYSSLSINPKNIF
ncbi:hypothetical protein BB560_006752, partial [Smittium megazygosporum]